jgi:DNA-binding NarL/FixJ family response regulator
MPATAATAALGVAAVIGDRLPLVCAGLETVLRRAGATKVVSCGSAAEALDAARSGAVTGTPALAPGRRGGTAEAVRGVVVVGAAARADLDVLRRRLPALDAPTVVLVDQIERAELVGLLECGAAAVALRSVTAEELVGIVRTVLGGERTVGPALMSVLVGFTGGLLSERDPAGSNRPKLTAKEHEVLARLARGESNAAIAAALYISPATVKSHLASIYAKLEVGTRLEATSRAVTLGLLE